MGDYDTPTLTFAEVLRHMRAEAGLTQEELARKAGLTPQAVGSLERGVRTRPYPQTVRALADALGLGDDAAARLRAAVPSRHAAVRSTAAEAGPAQTSMPFGVPSQGQVLDPASPHDATELTVPPTRLHGRAEDLAAVEQAFKDGTRIATLTGPGGVGKTRLAAALAERLRPHFPDGVVSVALAGLSSGAEVLPAVARTLGLAGGDGPASAAAVLERLRDSKTLLVLDNCEHLLSCAPDVGALVSAAPGLAVLSTSRAPLRLRGEWEYVVEPLPLPPSGVTSEKSLVSSPAGALLLERARAVSPRLVVDAPTASALSDLCRELAGLPLAIELVSAHLRLFDPQSLARRLHELPESLAARDLPARQRTMRASLEWSYDLLDADQQQLFRVLAAFRGGATYDAVLEVAAHGADLPERQVLPLLDDLVASSMVVAVRRPGAEVRYSMLEPVAQFARTLLIGDEAARIERAHASYCLALVLEAADGMEGAEQLGWLDLLETEESDIVLAADRAAALGEVDTAAQIVWGMWLFWWLRSQVFRGRRVAEACLAAGPGPQWRGRVLFTTGTMAYGTGDLETARLHWGEAMELARADDDRELAAKTSSCLGLAALAGRDLARAEAQFLHTIDTVASGDAGSTWAQSIALGFLGTSRLLRGDLDRAAEAMTAARTLAKERGDRMAAYNALHGLAQVSLARRDLVAAVEHIVEGVRLAQETKDIANLARFSETLAVTRAFAGDVTHVPSLLGAADTLRAHVGSRMYGYWVPDPTQRDRAVQAARSALGDEAYEAAVADAASLDLEGVVELTLRVACESVRCTNVKPPER